MGEADERKRPTQRVNALRKLIESGRLSVGTHLTHRGRTVEINTTATVVRDGVRIGDQTYASLLTAARAVAKHSVNGWTFWQFESGESIDRLRKNA